MAESTSDCDAMRSPCIKWLVITSGLCAPSEEPYDENGEERFDPEDGVLMFAPQSAAGITYIHS